jgi:hypothetical protein
MLRLTAGRGADYEQHEAFCGGREEVWNSGAFPSGTVRRNERGELRWRLKRETAIPKFPLRLMPSVRRTAELFSEKEGVSLNQIINVVVAEKLAHLEHGEWVRSRKRPTKELAARALSLLDKASNRPVLPGDELPKGYRAKRR